MEVFLSIAQSDFGVNLLEQHLLWHCVNTRLNATEALIEVVVTLSDDQLISSISLQHLAATYPFNLYFFLISGSSKSVLISPENK